MPDPLLNNIRILSRREAFRQGSEGLYEEVNILRRRWGFALSTVELPIRIWHGDTDDMVSVSFSMELAGRLPKVQLELLPEAGHFIVFSHWQSILRKLKEDSQQHMVNAKDAIS